MNARAKNHEAAAPDARDLAEKHERMLLRCRQVGRPVVHSGVKKFIAGVHLHKGETEMIVYLEGSPEPVRPCDLSMMEQTND